MKHRDAHLVSPRTDPAGFTLTEIVLALAVIAIAFVALLGMLPAGLDQSRQAANSTVTAAILEDVNHRLMGLALQSSPKSSTETITPSFTAYYDDHGVFIPTSASAAEKARRLYRAEIRIGAWKTKPADTSALRPITVELAWPLEPTTGSPIGPNPKTVVTYPVSTLTGLDWKVIDSGYVPKIEF
jgi:uncharacterized protein (TIGR02598 family)